MRIRTLFRLVVPGIVGVLALTTSAASVADAAPQRARSCDCVRVERADASPRHAIHRHFRHALTKRGGQSQNGQGGGRAQRGDCDGKGGRQCDGSGRGNGETRSGDTSDDEETLRERRRRKARHDGRDRGRGQQDRRQRRERQADE